LTGRNAAGKGTIADLLKRRSFTYHSLSDTLRDEIRKKGIEESRDELIRVGNELRLSGGPSVLADLMIKNISTSGNHIVDSIRNPSEVDSLNRKYSNHEFYLISVDADSETRFQRLKKRGRIGDSNTWEQFLYQEALEESDDPSKQQLLLTMKKADFSLDNSGTIEQLENQIDKIFEGL
jgi:dephospho-CoA kinase